MAYQTSQLIVVAVFLKRVELIARKLHQQNLSATLITTVAVLQKLRIDLFAGVTMMLGQNSTNQTRPMDFVSQKLVTSFLSSRTNSAL